MAVTQKTLFTENLDKYNTFVTDTDPFSKYFKITELSDTFTGGKNAFLIQGSEQLVADTLIKIEIKDSQGNTIYYEPGEGIVSSSVAGESVVTEYYEGVSKVIAVHIYPDTSFGPATITILGELSDYYNDAGVLIPVPSNWQGTYNVKWQKQVTVNPKLPNTTKIRFYKRPTASISETLSPIYTIVSGSKIESNIVSSFANVTLSKLDTFAGDVKRIKVYRTSEGDISDYDMIQDILVESKELLTSYELTGSVVGEAGLMTSEVLEKLWSYPTLTTQLTSSRVDNGVKLNGSGYFTYSSSLNLSENSVYEFGVDAFYSASNPSNMGIYVSGSNNGEVLVGTLTGIAPTKNLKDSVFQFTLPLAEPTASLYLSQSQSEWHIGNLSLKLTEDTAFSPSEISFVTSMPTVVGNETYNFKFEFYDVNNNYVPVLVTQSALFTGGNNNIGGTLTFISASASASAAELAAVSSSISGTMTVYSSSASGSITTLSGSVSGSITSLSSSVSSSITSLSASVSSSNAIILSSSFAQVKNLANGQYSGSFIGDNVIYSPAIGGQQGYIKELFTVGDNTSSTINLDARTSIRKIYIGTGAFNNTNTGVYLDSNGNFSLKDKLIFDGTSLTVNGTINANAGNFSGNITSTATISGGTISGGTISGGTISIGSGNNIFKATTDGISLGNATFASAPFRVTPAGVLTATNANITGAITATSLTLSGFSLTGNDVGLGNVQNYSAQNQAKVGIEASITIASGGIAMSGGGFIRGGQSDYNTGTGFFLGYSGSNYKFSIGDGSTKGITWDGATLTIGGNAVIGASTIATIASNANAALQPGANITSLANNAGYQDNGSAKTAGSVGGWSIDGSSIKSNNNQTILYNTGIISLTDGSTERIRITKDNLVQSSIATSTSTNVEGADQTLSSTGGTTWNYYGSHSRTRTSGVGYSNQFGISQDALTISVTYQGSSVGQPNSRSGIGTAFSSNVSSIPNYQYSTFVFTASISISLQRFINGGWETVDTQSKQIYYEYINGTMAGAVSTGYSGGVTAAAFGGLNTSYQYRVGTAISWSITSAAIAYTFSSSVPAWSLSVNQYTLPAQTFTINALQLSQKLEIGLNGIQISSAGGLTAIGAAAGAGLAGTFTGDVKVAGSIQAAAFNSTSDERLKTDIREIDSPMVKLSQLNPKSFLWNDATAPLTDKGYSYGFIAQDIQKYFPELVKVVKGSVEYENLLTVEYNAIIALITAAMREMASKVELLEDRVLELEEQIQK
jgi:hypothetical protein